MSAARNAEYLAGMAAYDAGELRICPYPAPDDKVGSPAAREWAARGKAWGQGWDAANLADTPERRRLEELRIILQSESISYGELIELQGLADHIGPGDVELLEPAGVPEFPDDIDAATVRP